MATNETLDSLVTRIDVATHTLENAVGVIVDSNTTLVEAVVQAEEAATLAGEHKDQAALEAQEAAQQANTATQAAIEASGYVDQVEDIKEAFENSYIVEEAPINGNEYVRKDGDWVLSSEGGVESPVASVNNILPDSQGNVELDYADVNALPSTYTPDYSEITNTPTLSNVAITGDYEDLTNKPTIPTQGVESLVAGDNITIDNTDPLNPIISASGGGGSGGGFPIEEASSIWWTSSGDTFGETGEWLYANPHRPIDLAELSTYVRGRADTLEAAFNGSVDMNSILLQLPSGNYYSSRLKIGASSNRYALVRLYHITIGSTLLPIALATDLATAVTYVWDTGVKSWVRTDP